MHLFLSLKGWQSFILWSVLCRFHSLYHCCHSLSLIAIYCHLLSLVVSLAVTLCHSLHHSLSFVVIRCHSLYHSLSLVVIRCPSLYHSLSLVVPIVVTHCHSFSLVVLLVVIRCHSLSLVVTRCTTRLSFCKRSNLLIDNDYCQSSIFIKFESTWTY